MVAVDFYFDLLCPWAYQASKWIREARTCRDIDVTWRFFSLEEGKWKDGDPHPWERPWSFGWSLLRVAAFLRDSQGGNESVDRFYEVAGRLFHEEGVKVHTQEGAEKALLEMGLDPGIVGEAIGDQATNDAVLADHRGGVERGAFGVPTLVLDRSDVFFGPVIAPAPVGDAAGRLWDGVTAWREFPHLYEIQRPKLEADMEHIKSQFAVYGVARGWSA